MALVRIPEEHRSISDPAEVLASALATRAYGGVSVPAAHALA